MRAILPPPVLLGWPGRRSAGVFGVWSLIIGNQLTRMKVKKFRDILFILKVIGSGFH
jgi:hypothetical protein